jgi:hypothetical protein
MRPRASARTRNAAIHILLDTYDKRRMGRNVVIGDHVLASSPVVSTVVRMIVLSRAGRLASAAWSECHGSNNHWRDSDTYLAGASLIAGNPDTVEELVR